jgi:hypothetical protein
VSKLLLDDWVWWVRIQNLKKYTKLLLDDWLCFSLSLALFGSIFVGLIENENLINQTTQKSRRDGVVLGCWGYNFLFLFFISLMSGLFFFGFFFYNNGWVIG